MGICDGPHFIVIRPRYNEKIRFSCLVAHFSPLSPTLYDGGGPPVVHQRHQWQIPPSDCRLPATVGPPVAFVPLIATGSRGGQVVATSPHVVTEAKYL